MFRRLHPFILLVFSVDLKRRIDVMTSSTFKNIEYHLVFKLPLESTICFGVVQGSFDNVIAAYMPVDPTKMTCKLVKNYIAKQFEYLTQDGRYVALFGVESTAPFIGSSGACMNLFDCARPSLCIKGKCSNNAPGVVSGFGFVSNDHH